MKQATLLILILAALPLLAQELPQPPVTPTTTTTAVASANVVAIGGQVSSNDGDESVFRELNSGEQEGLFLDLLQMSGTSGDSAWTLDSRFTTGRSGWLDVTGRFGAWTTGVQFNQRSTWSALSFAEEFLPSGTPVETLYPGTTKLDPVFGIDEPRMERRRFEAFAFRRFGLVNALGVRVIRTERDGERVPNIGGSSFSELGTPSFHTAGLERSDDATTTVALEGRFATGAFSTRFDAGISQRETGEAYASPAYGSAALLDLNVWNDGIDDDSRWARADGLWDRGRFAVHGGLTWYDGDGELSGSDARETTAGVVTRAGLSLTSGTIDYSGTSAALGVVYRRLEWLTLMLAGDTRERSSQGNGSLLRRDAAFADALSEIDESRVGATLDVRGTMGRTRLRLRSRVSTTENDTVEERGAFFEDVTRETDRVDIRADMTRDLSRASRLRVSGRVRSDETSVTLHALDDGFATGDREREEAGGTIELAFGDPAQRTTLSFTTFETDIENAEPFVDPIFDPSVPFGGEDASISVQRLTAGT
ncbi:MAG: hypothetical protein ACYC9N_12595, partial [Thermoanaerobaculia bacterium]